jgi:hypothetical protein
LLPESSGLTGDKGAGLAPPEATGVTDGNCKDPEVPEDPAPAAEEGAVDAPDSLGPAVRWVEAVI